MISYEEALDFMQINRRDFGNEVVDFRKAKDRVLSEDIVADRDFPPFDRSAMDGIAIRWKEFEEGQRTFRIIGEQVAGASQQCLTEPGSCLEIMTGATLPKGADAVIRYEDVEITDQEAFADPKNSHQWMNVHKQGTDAHERDVLIPAGKKITVGDIGLLATVGKSTVSVKKLPRVALLSTGDELVEVDQEPLPHQIRKSNIYTLGILLSDHGITHEVLHFNDEKEEIERGLMDLMEAFDVIMMSGGVSKGKRDFVPEALEKIGVNKVFHRIAQRPGKPMWFGQNDKVTVFGFPGNPVSTVACFTIYFREWLHTCLLQKPLIVHGKLKTRVHFKPDLSYHVPVSITYNRNEIEAAPIIGSGSGDLTVLSHAQGFLTLPNGKDEFAEGDLYELRFF